MKIDLSAPYTQTVLAAMVGVSQPAISAWVNAGKLPSTGALGDVLAVYCARLREQAAGRLGTESGGLDLVQERAALARSQRVAQDYRNAITQKEYAPIGMIADVIGMAGSAVVDRLDQLEGALRKAVPALDDDTKNVILSVMASARNEWVRGTIEAVGRGIDGMLQPIAVEQDDGDGQQPEDVEA